MQAYAIKQLTFIWNLVRLQFRAYEKWILQNESGLAFEWGI